MESALDFYTARALLEWQLEFGADEAIADAPVNRFELAADAPKKPKAPEPVAMPACKSGRTRCKWRGRWQTLHLRLKRFGVLSALSSIAS